MKTLIILTALLLMGCGASKKYGWEGDKARYSTAKVEAVAFKETRYRCLKESQAGVAQGVMIQNNTTAPKNTGGGFAGGFGSAFNKSAAESAARHQARPRVIRDDVLFKACMEQAGFTLIEVK